LPRPTLFFDEAAAQADAQEDGYYALITTVSLQFSADLLFTQFKRQAFVELSHHQWKTPIAVRPVFLKTPERVEALVYLLKIGLTAYHLLQRLYRQQAVRDQASVPERRMTSETILRIFSNCTLQIARAPLGRVVNVTQLTSRQRGILHRLRFPTPLQQIQQRLPRYPPRP
jgi:transposase